MRPAAATRVTRPKHGGPVSDVCIERHHGHGQSIDHCADQFDGLGALHSGPGSALGVLGTAGQNDQLVEPAPCSDRGYGQSVAASRDAGL